MSDPGTVGSSVGNSAGSGVGSVVALMFASLLGALALPAVILFARVADDDLPIFPANGETALVQAVDNAFAPVDAEIVAGTELVWLNRGRNDHNIIPEFGDDAWTFQDTEFGPGDEVSFVFETPGTYRYYCSIHGTLTAGMPGVIVVTEPS